MSLIAIFPSRSLTQTPREPCREFRVIGTLYKLNSSFYKKEKKPFQELKTTYKRSHVNFTFSFFFWIFTFLSGSKFIANITLCKLMSISNSRTLYTDYIQLQRKYEHRHQTKNQNILKCHWLKCTYYNISIKGKSNLHRYYGNSFFFQRNINWMPLFSMN